MTIFEDIHDDIFDGELGENDEDLPKVLMNFSLKQMSPAEKTRKGRTDIKEFNPERDRSPTSILKNSSINSLSSFFSLMKF